MFTAIERELRVKERTLIFPSLSLLTLFNFLFLFLIELLSRYQSSTLQAVLFADWKLNTNRKRACEGGRAW